VAVYACTPLRRLKQEDCMFKVSLGYIVRPYLKQTRHIDMTTWIKIKRKQNYNIMPFMFKTNTLVVFTYIKNMTK
jgi:hypothetical protein